MPHYVAKRRDPQLDSASMLENRFMKYANPRLEAVRQSYGEEPYDTLYRYMRLSVLPKLRAHCERTEDGNVRPYEEGCSRMKRAISFVEFAYTRDRTERTCTKADVELFAQQFHNRADIRSFLGWLNASGISTTRWKPKITNVGSYDRLSDARYHEQMDRLLHDDTIALRARCFARTAVAGFRTRAIFATTVSDLDSVERTLRIDDRNYQPFEEDFTLLLKLRERLLQGRSPEQAADEFLFGDGGQTTAPTIEPFTFALLSNGISVRSLRNTATRISLQMLPQFLSFTQTTRQSIPNILFLAKRFHGRGGVYAATLARAGAAYKRGT